MSDPGTDEEERAKRRRAALLLFILIDTLVVMAGVAFFGWRLLSGHGDGKEKAGETKGERFEFSAFYYANDGEWVLGEPETHVLKEQKYVSSKHELPQYLVRTLPPGTRVRIVKAEQRWKEVEALEGEKVLCRGWVDANGIRKVAKYEPPKK